VQDGCKKCSGNKKPRRGSTWWGFFCIALNQGIATDRLDFGPGGKPDAVSIMNADHRKTAIDEISPNDCEGAVVMHREPRKIAERRKGKSP
jgi:hypothetical protein